MNVYDFSTGRPIDLPTLDERESGLTVDVVAASNDPQAHELMQGAARSLRRRGIAAAVRRGQDWAGLECWMVVARSQDVDRARAAFDAYMKRVNARSANRRPHSP